MAFLRLAADLWAQQSPCGYKGWSNTQSIQPEAQGLCAYTVPVRLLCPPKPLPGSARHRPITPETRGSHRRCPIHTLTGLTTNSILIPVRRPNAVCSVYDSFKYRHMAGKKQAALALPGPHVSCRAPERGVGEHLGRSTVIRRVEMREEREHQSRRHTTLAMGACITAATNERHRDYQSHACDETLLAAGKSPLQLFSCCRRIHTLGMSLRVPIAT